VIAARARDLFKEPADMIEASGGMNPLRPEGVLRHLRDLSEVRENQLPARPQPLLRSNGISSAKMIHFVSARHRECKCLPSSMFQKQRNS
jgi:hypothetical protein